MQGTAGSLTVLYNHRLPATAERPETRKLMASFVEQQHSEMDLQLPRQPCRHEPWFGGNGGVMLTLTREHAIVLGTASLQDGID